MWRPDETEDFLELANSNEFRDVRREVWDLIQICAAQEGNLLTAVSIALESEIQGSTSIHDNPIR